MVSKWISTKSLQTLTNGKLVSAAYENARIVEKEIENAYGQAKGFANSLRNISALPPEEQRDAIDNALAGFLTGDESFTTVFAYFEQNVIADADGQPYSVHNTDIAYEAVAYMDESGEHVSFEKHEDAFDNFEKEYYMQIKETRQPYVMDPYIYELMGKNIMMISIIAPILDADGNFLGVTGVDVGLENMQEELLVSTDYKTAHLTALAADGTILMDSADAQKVGMSAKDAGYETLMEDAQKVYAMQEGEYQNSRYLIKSGKNFGTGKRGMTVTIPLTIGGKAKWSLHMAVNSSEFNWAIIESTGKLTFIVVVFGILLLFSVNRIIKSFLEPIQTITDGAAKLEAGDLNIHIDISSDDELGRLSQAFNHISTTMSNYVKDISEQLSKMAENHMDIAITQDYIGDFIPIQASIEKISQSLNDTLHEIVLSADEVAASSENVSSGAQVLSDGAAEQAAAIDELAASIDSLSKDVAANANDAQTANTAVTQVSASIAQSNKEMDDLTEAMAKINASSEEIEKIVKTIEDIAEQTNLLSLNASIEAARAGEAGKGFAVVANQIRELAAKSAEAVNQTADLIRTSQNAVENGMGIAEHTADSLVAVVNGAKEVLCSMEKISNASQNQKSVLEQLTRHVDAISGVVQSNSSAAKGSADTSAELSAQSKRLHELVSKFHLKQM